MDSERVWHNCSQRAIRRTRTMIHTFDIGPTDMDSRNDVKMDRRSMRGSKAQTV